MASARKIPPLKTVRYALETVAAYLAYGFFSLLPPEAASDLGGAVMRRVGPRLDASRGALRNIGTAFPEKTEAEKHDILTGMWDNLGRVIAEYPHLGFVRDNLDLRGTEHLAKDGGPCIFFSGHIANWEAIGPAARRAGLPVSIVYRKPNNPWVDGLLKRARSEGVAGHIPKGSDGAREIIATLKKGGNIGMLIDQRLNEGVAVPFFGHDAMTADAPAILALKFRCPLYPVRVERLGACRFRLTVLPSVDVSATGDRDADVRRILTEMNRLLEDWIRHAPAHWLWTHRRWAAPA